MFPVSQQIILRETDCHRLFDAGEPPPRPGKRATFFPSDSSSSAHAGRPKALEELKKSLALNADSPHTWFHIGACQLALGRFRQAMFCFRKAEGLGKGHIAILALSGCIQEKAGLAGDSARTYQRIEKRCLLAERRGSSDWTHLAALAAARHDHTRAISALRRALRVRDPELVGIGAEPLFDGVRSLPAFRRIAAKAGVHISVC